MSTRLRDVSKLEPKQLPARTLVVLVPNETDVPCLGLVDVTDHRLQRGILVKGPILGRFCAGDLVAYSYDIGLALPIVTAGYGPFNG